MMRVGIVVLLIAMAIGTGSAGDKPKQRKAKPKKKAVAEVSFNKTIAPILKVSCLPCHTEDAMNPSLLYLDSYENLMAGGKHGAPVLPKNADSSLLIRKLQAAVPFGDPMPLKRKSLLSKDTIAILRTWIMQGAKNN